MRVFLVLGGYGVGFEGVFLIFYIVFGLKLGRKL